MEALATTSSSSLHSDPSKADAASANNTNEKIQEYDFVIIGHGLAGTSAVGTLQKLCPQATIAVIDPNLTAPRTGNRKKSITNVEYIPATCSGFHPLSRQVQLTNTNTTNNICYRHAVLVATGSRGAPPPHYLIDDRVLPRILELRPTLLPYDNQNHYHTTKPRKRPIETSRQIRQKVLQAAKQGEHVAILGSGWDAVELAVAISAAVPSANLRKNKTAASLFFGGKGPLSHVLPMYLSSAVSKRLKTRKIDILDRSLIRYIGGDYHNDESLHVYTAKSYDLLDSGRASCKWLVGKCSSIYN